MKIKRPALSYYGGKFLIAPWIISFFPPHNNYVEPCGGAASVLIQKKKSKLETFNDIDNHVYNFFKVLRDFPDELIRKIKLTPWSREEFKDCIIPSEDPIENARRFYCSSFMAISHAPFDKTSGMHTTSYYGQLRSLTGLNFSDAVYLYQIADRFKEIQIENRDCKYIIERYDRYDSLIYFDPPYIKEKRTHKNKYRFDADDDFHIEMAEILKKCKGFVVISGYECNLYKELYENYGFRRFDKVFLMNGGVKRKESLWICPKTIKMLNKPMMRRWE